MGFFAPRITNRLLVEIERLAAMPFRSAEICREVGETAARWGLRRPSYEQVRLIVTRSRRRPKRVSTAKVLLDIALRTEHPDAFVQHVSGVNTRFERK